jgi:CDGSH-type Zn-finger protein
MSDRVEPVARAVRGGPLIVEGGVSLSRLERGPRGYLLAPDIGAGDTYALCRCAGSSRLPFCDREPPYRCFDEETPTVAVSTPFTWELPDGSEPAIALKPNGPVRVAGGLPVYDGDGLLVDPGERVSLCRCGASRCQPVCDGSHKVVGYREPR